MAQEIRRHVEVVHPDIEGTFRRIFPYEAPSRYQRLVRKIGPVALSAVLLSNLTSPFVPRSAGAGADVSPGAPITSIGTSGGDVIINGQPTLVYGMWQPATVANALAGIQNVGVNMIIGTDPLQGQSPDMTDGGIAVAVENQAWVLPQAANLDSNYNGTPPPSTSNQAGVSFEDEPDFNCYPPSDFAGQASANGITFQNYSENIASGVPDSCTPQTDYPVYIANLGPNGVATLDFYPINEYSCGAEPLTISSMYRYVLTLRARAAPGMPIGAYIETGPVGNDACNSTPVTPTDMADEIWEAVAAGATVINPWLYTTASNPYGISTANAAAFKADTQELDQYSNILLAEQNPSFFTNSPTDPNLVNVGERIVNPGPNQTNYIIAVNGTGQQLSWSGALPDLTSKESVEVTSAVDSSTLQAKNGILSFNLPANSWQIYGYQPSTAVPTKAAPKMAPSIKTRKSAARVASSAKNKVAKSTKKTVFVSVH